MSEQLTLGIEPPTKVARPARAPKVVIPHAQARRDGVEDGKSGDRRNAHRWPSGTYGHADYELGFAEGEFGATAGCAPSETPPLNTDETNGYGHGGFAEGER